LVVFTTSSNSSVPGWIRRPFLHCARLASFY